MSPRQGLMLVNEPSIEISGSQLDRKLRRSDQVSQECSDAAPRGTTNTKARGTDAQVSHESSTLLH